MDYRTLKKVNELALSLKHNRIAANMEEAVELAKNMLTKDPTGRPISTEALEEMNNEVKDESTELAKLAGESEALKIDAQQAHEREHSQAKDAHEHSKEFSDLKKEVDQTKKTVKAIKDISEDLPDVESKEEDAYEEEEAAQDDLPGEREE